jgi:hypothetical protein
MIIKFSFRIIILEFSMTYSSLRPIASGKVATTIRRKMTATKVTNIVYNTRSRSTKKMTTTTANQIVVEKVIILPVECKMVEKTTTAPRRHKNKRKKHKTFSTDSPEKIPNNYGECTKNRGPRMMLPRAFEPCEFDVICAKGAVAFQHAGNVRFRHLVLDRAEAYKNAKSKDVKTQIVNALVDLVRNEAHEHHGRGGGGFVRQCEEDHSRYWVEIGDEAAREKAGQTIREHIIKANPALCHAKRARRRKQRKEMNTVVVPRQQQRTRTTILVPAVSANLINEVPTFMQTRVPSTKMSSVVEMQIEKLTEKTSPSASSLSIPVTPSAADDCTDRRGNKNDESSVTTSRTSISPQLVSEYSVKEDSSDLMLISLEKLPSLVYMTSRDWFVREDETSTDENTTSDDHHGDEFQWNTFERRLVGWPEV